MANNNKREGRRFSIHSEAEIDRKKAESTPKNTLSANSKAGRVFRAYLMERGDGTERVDFEDFSEKELNSALEGFWFSARTIKGELYKASTLETLRHSLSRYLRSPPFNKGYDLIKDKEFRSSSEAFKGALRELKAEGKGEIKHHAEIRGTDLTKLYTAFDHLYTGHPNPALLQAKVQFDVRYFFFRRGSENMHSMNKATFAVKTNADGERYVCKEIDELNKNHGGNSRESYSAFMPEIRGSNRCPVTSFILYHDHLHPECESLWQRPRHSVGSQDTVWFYRRPVGIDKLRFFMKDLSQRYQLSEVYTNHSIRVTGATILTRQNFASSQIKEVTGHKSVSSLAIYQRVSETEKLDMGRTLALSVMPAASDREPVSYRRPATATSTCTTPDPKLASSVYDQSAMPVTSSCRPKPLPHPKLASSFAYRQSAVAAASPYKRFIPKPNPAPSTRHQPAVPAVIATHVPTPTILEQDSDLDLVAALLSREETEERTAPIMDTVVYGEMASPVRPTNILSPIDFDLSPYLRDLESDPHFEESLVELQLEENVMDRHGSRRVNIRQARQAHHPRPQLPMHMFSGCTIHNLVIQMAPEPRSQEQ